MGKNKKIDGYFFFTSDYDKHYFTQIIIIGKITI